MITAKCKECGFSMKITTDLLNKRIHCLSCKTLQEFVEIDTLAPIIEYKTATKFMGDYDSFEQRACTLVRVPQGIAEDQLVARRDHVDVAPCPAPPDGFCDCWLDRVLETLYAEGRISGEELDGLSDR
jgi:hypothetical protein